MTLSNIDRFLDFFRRQSQQYTCSKLVIVNDPTTLQTRRYTL